MDENKEILRNLRRKLRTRENGPASDAMSALGIKYKRNHGLSINHIKEISKEYKYNNDLAKLFYEQDVREIKLLAFMILEHTQENCDTITKWINNLEDTEQAEQFAINLLAETKYCLPLFSEYAQINNQFSQRAVFVSIARIAMTKGNIVDNETYNNFIKLCTAHSGTEYINVAKAISWALRRIGRINRKYKDLVLQSTKNISNNNAPHLQLILDEVNFELTDEFIVSTIPEE